VNNSETSYSLENADIDTVPIVTLIDALHKLLKELIVLADDIYTTKPYNLQGVSTIGSHVRHILDHVDAFLSGLEIGHIKYHERVRDTEVERNKKVAILHLENLIKEIIKIKNKPIETKVIIEDILSVDHPPYIFTSTLGRELAFVFNHSFHHYAIISIIIKSYGGFVPEDFGYAPSTMLWLRSCVHTR